MSSKMLLSAIVMGLSVSAVHASTDANNGDMIKSQAETVKVMMVEVGPTGKPPYKRSFVELPVTDIAAMEVEESAPSVKRAASRPPFNRHR